MLTTKLLRSDIPFPAGRFPFYYGFVIVIAASAGFLLSAPGQTIGVSVFTDALITVLHTSRMTVSAAYAAGTICSAILVRRYADRVDTVGARTVGIAACLGLGLALFFISAIGAVRGLFSAVLPRAAVPAASFMALSAAFMAMRFFGQGMITLASRTMLMKWFDRLQGRVNSLSGIMVSLMFSGSPALFELLIKQYAWHGAWRVMGLFMLTGAVLFVYLFFRDSAAGCGLTPDGPFGKARFGNTPVAVPERSRTLAEAKRTSALWIFCLGTGLFALQQTAFTFHVVSLFAQVGLPRAAAVAIFPPGAVIAMCVNLAAGILADTRFFRNRLHWFLACTLVGLIFSSAGAMMLGSPAGIPLLITGNGICAGLFGLVTTVIWPRYYGTAHMGAIAGYNMSWMVAASALGPALFAFGFRLSGSYTPAFAVSGAAGLLLLGLNRLAARPAE